MEKNTILISIAAVLAISGIALVSNPSITGQGFRIPFISPENSQQEANDPFGGFLGVIVNEAKKREIVDYLKAELTPYIDERVSMGINASEKDFSCIVMSSEMGLSTGDERCEVLGYHCVAIVRSSFSTYHSNENCGGNPVRTGEIYTEVKDCTQFASTGDDCQFINGLGWTKSRESAKIICCSQKPSEQ